MSYPTGVRDGDFVRFDGWDVPGNDVGRYFTDLDASSRVAKLKDASGYYGALFFAFNTNGWAKSWTKIDPSKFVRASGSSLYIRVEFSGWTFYPKQDSPGNDFSNVGLNASPAIIATINKRTNPFEVVAFRSNGWIKSKTTYPLKTVSGDALFEGLYVRWGS